LEVLCALSSSSASPRCRPVPYKKVAKPKVKLPKRRAKNKYDDQSSLKGRRFVAEKY
jgi:polyphosphate kinase